MGTQVVERAVPGSSAAIEVRCEGPFAVGVTLWRDESRRVFATVVATVAYALDRGKLELIEATEPIRDQDELAPFKPSHEVLIIGDRRACSPRARVEVGGIEIMVATMPPLKRGGVLRPEDSDWLADPIRFARPKGFDPSYFLTAPPDQRSSEPFHADEWLVLEALQPEHPRLVTRLGGVTPAMRAVEPTLPFVADTLAVDVDQRIVMLAFRAIVPLREETLFLEVVAEGTARSGAVVGPTNEATAEFDRSTFDLAAADVLPFPASSELAPSHMGGSLAGLPFRQGSGGPGKERVRVRTRSDNSLFSAFFSRGAERIKPKLPSKAPEPAADMSPMIEPAFPMSARATSDAAVSAPVAEVAAPPPLVQNPLPPRPVDARPHDVAHAPHAPSATSVAAASPSHVVPVLTAPVRHEYSRAVPPERPVGIVRRAIVDLVAWDPTVPARLRRSRLHAPLLSDDARPESDQSARERNDVLRVLSCGAPVDPADLQGAVDSALDDLYDWDIPLLLVEGSLRPTMDEVETLRVATSIAQPLAGPNNRALARAQEALSASRTLAPGTATLLYKQLHGSMQELSVPTGRFADLVNSALVQARSFKKLTLLGRPRIRAELSMGSGRGGPEVFPIYLPDAAATRMPLIREFPVVALVELRPREDVSESNPEALVALAIGRVLRARDERAETVSRR